MSEISNLINQSKKHLTRYEYPQVIECCDKILKTDSESWWGLKYKGISLYQTEQYDKAILVYEKHYELYPDDEDTISTLIEMYEKQGKYEKALKLCQEASQNDYIKNQEKRLKTKMKLFPEIIREYDDKLENLISGYIIKARLNTPDIPRRIEKHIKLMRLLEEKGIYQYRNREYDKAYDTFQKVSQSYNIIKPFLKHKPKKWYERLNKLLTQYTNSKEFFQELLSTESNIDIWYDKLEYILTSFEDYLVYIDILLEENPDNIKILELSGTISRFKYHDYPLKCWKKILELEPENTKAIQQILNIYRHQYSKDRALKLINSKLYIKDIQTDLLVQKIQILESMTLYDEALETYEKYLSLDLPDGLTYHKLTIFDKLRCMEQKALSYYLEDNLIDSFKLYKNISEIFSNTKRQPYVIPPQEWYIEDWYKKVLGESIHKSKDNMETFYKEFYENKENIPLWIKRIEHIQTYSNILNSLTYCDILLDKFPEDKNIKLTKANVYYKTSRYEEALELYEKILEKEPENTTAQNSKFNTLVTIQEYDKAYEHLKTIEINIQEIHDNIYWLAQHLLKEEEYEKAKYSYELLLKNNKGSNKIITKLKYIWNMIKDTKSQNNSPYYMDWINLINYKHKDYECPTCGGKLIPIKYGYFEPKEGEVGVKYRLGGCIVRNDSPTDYCTKCEKEINMGTYGIDITCENIELLGYTQEKIVWLTEYIENNPTKNITEIGHEINKKFAIDKKEFTMFIEKLEKIGHLKIEENQIKLNRDYKKFHNLFISGCYYSI